MSCSVVNFYSCLFSFFVNCIAFSIWSVSACRHFVLFILKRWGHTLVVLVWINTNSKYTFLDTCQKNAWKESNLPTCPQGAPQIVYEWWVRSLIKRRRKTAELRHGDETAAAQWSGLRRLHRKLLISRESFRWWRKTNERSKWLSSCRLRTWEPSWTIGLLQKKLKCQVWRARG